MFIEGATLWTAANSLVSVAAAIGAARVAYTSSTKSKKFEKGSTVTTELRSITVVERSDRLPGPDDKFDDLPRPKMVVQRIEREGKQTIDLSASAESASAAVAAAAEVLQKGEVGVQLGSAGGLRGVGSDYNLDSATMRAFHGSGQPIQYGVLSAGAGQKMNATTQSVAVFVNGVTKAPGISDNAMSVAYNGGPSFNASWQRAPGYDPEAAMPTVQYQRLRMQVDAIQTSYGQQLAMLNSRVEQLEKMAGVGRPVMHMSRSSEAVMV